MARKSRRSPKRYTRVHRNASRSTVDKPVSLGRVADDLLAAFFTPAEIEELNAAEIDAPTTRRMRRI